MQHTAGRTTEEAIAASKKQGFAIQAITDREGNTIQMAREGQVAPPGQYYEAFQRRQAEAAKPEKRRIDGVEYEVIALNQSEVSAAQKQAIQSMGPEYAKQPREPGHPLFLEPFLKPGGQIGWSTAEQREQSALRGQKETWDLMGVPASRVLSKTEEAALWAPGPTLHKGGGATMTTEQGKAWGEAAGQGLMDSVSGFTIPGYSATSWGVAKNAPKATGGDTPTEA